LTLTNINENNIVSW